MSYENPPVPEEVNVSRDSVLAEFLRLLAALVLLVAAAAVILYITGGWLARFIPFEMEAALAGDQPLGFSLPAADEALTPRRRYLQSLAERLAATMDLPPGMQLTVHYVETDVPNAFATLGGHIIVTSGLHTRMPSENALALVLAHEIAHIRARDPVSAVGGAALLQLGLVLAGATDAGSLAPHVAYAVQLGYSRRVEQRADTLAMEAVRQVYGHLGGTAATFEVLSDYRAEEGTVVPSLLSTHPADAVRIARLRDAAADWDPARQPLQPIPEL